MYRSSINVDLDKVDVSEGLGEGLELGGHGTARTAPDGIEIDDNLGNI